jgi:AcrR family transcriptional regulator
MAGRQSVSVPRGRYAPPLGVRRGVQRRRLFRAAAAVFARVGYAEAGAEAISREAGMSKATFYEHFANKEECILALCDEAVAELTRALAHAGRHDGHASYEQHVATAVRAFMDAVAASPDPARTMLVEMIGAGPRAMSRRDEVLDAFAGGLHRDNARVAPRYGAPTFVAEEDAFAVVGATVELVSRHLRTGRPAERTALEPVITRLVLGTLDRAEPR